MAEVDNNVYSEPEYEEYDEDRHPEKCHCSDCDPHYEDRHPKLSSEIFKIYKYRYYIVSRGNPGVYYSNRIEYDNTETHSLLHGPEIRHYKPGTDRFDIEFDISYMELNKERDEDYERRKRKLERAQSLIDILPSGFLEQTVRYIAVRTNLDIEDLKFVADIEYNNLAYYAKHEPTDWCIWGTEYDSLDIPEAVHLIFHYVENAIQQRYLEWDKAAGNMVELEICPRYNDWIWLLCYNRVVSVMAKLSDRLAEKASSVVA